MARPPRVVLVTGAIGAGKTTVTIEAGALLADRGIPHALLDLDWLGWVNPAPPQGVAQIIARNLAAVWPVLRDSGIECLVMCRSVATASELSGIADAVAPARLTVVRLEASSESISKRLHSRDRGRILEEHLRESRTMDAALGGWTTSAISVGTDGRSPEAVAEDVLTSAGIGPARDESSR